MPDPETAPTNKEVPMSITITAAQDGAPQVDMHNGNAADVLDLLGICWDGDLGEAPAEDFLGRVLLAQALLDVARDDQEGTPALHEGRWHVGGRRPGYLAERLTELHDVADWAARAGVAVVWG
jgi:hypothetical protein